MGEKLTHPHLHPHPHPHKHTHTQTYAYTHNHIHIRTHKYTNLSPPSPHTRVLLGQRFTVVRSRVGWKSGTHAHTTLLYTPGTTHTRTYMTYSNHKTLPQSPTPTHPHTHTHTHTHAHTHTPHCCTHLGQPTLKPILPIQTTRQPQTHPPTLTHAHTPTHMHTPHSCTHLGQQVALHCGAV